MKHPSAFGVRAEVRAAVFATTPCPRCDAEPGNPCVCVNTKSKMWHKPINAPHAERIEGWHALGLPTARRSKLVDVVEVPDAR